MADKKFKVKNGLELNRVDSSNEGGEIAFNRASDNSNYWYIDVFGNTSTPSLRFIEDTNARFQIGSGGVLLINGSAGTSGQVLTSGGSGAAPTWTTLSAGSGDVVAASNNAFTGANTFTNTTGQIFRRSTNQDGLLIRGNANGTTGLTMELLPANLTSSVALTLPAATDQLVGRATTDTLTNKTLTLPTIDNIKLGYTTTATAAGTTTLTSSSNYLQYFTGTTTQTVTLPVASTMVLGQGFEIHNNSTGTVTVNSSGGNAVIAVDSGETAKVTCILTSGTTAASWDADFTGATTNTGSGALVFGTSPTLGGPTLNNAILTGTLTAGGGVGSNGQVLQSTGTGVQWATASGGGVSYTTTATAAGTTVLTSSSTETQFFTGTTTQTITLPVASTMTLGQDFFIHNNSTGNLTVNSSGGNLVATVEGGKTVQITCILTSGTTAASWDADFTGASTTTGTGALVYGTSPQISQIELGHASDTTITRAAAGRIAVEGVNVVTISSTDTLTNKTLTTPIISSISNTGTLTLPTSTDTLVGRATTDTLTNKTLTTPVLSGTASGTTAGRLGYLSGVLSFGDGTSQLTVATTTGTQTLTNKTIDLGSNTVTFTSAQLATACSNETGSGALVFGTGPTLAAPVLSGGSGTTAGALGFSGGNLIFGDGTAQQTVVTLSQTQTLTNKTLTTPAIQSGGFTIAGSTGTITVQAASTASGTLVLPATGTSDSVVARNTNDTLTNKTLTTPTLSNSASGTTSGRLGYLAGVLYFGDGTVQREVVTLDNTQTLTNKTLTSPSITSATLTTPRMASASHIADSNGNELILFPTAVASAVNEITVSNAATGAAPSITASGGDTNVTLNLRAKGTGTVNIGSTGLSVSGSSSGSTTLVSAATASGTLTLPSATDTVVARATSDALTNKTYNGLTVSTTTGTLTLANGSTLATSGAFSTTLTATAATNVTLPTTGTLATQAGTETLTNKRVDPRVTTTSSATGTLSIDTDLFDVYNITSTSGNITVQTTTDVPVNGQKLVVRVFASSNHTITFSSTNFIAGGVTMDITMTSSKWHHWGFIYNADYAGGGKWMCVAQVTQA